MSVSWRQHHSLRALHRRIASLAHGTTLTITVLLGGSTAGAALGQVLFEDTTFVGWTTVASEETTVRDPDSAVSAERIGTGEAAYYVVHHDYPEVDRAPIALPACCVSSLSLAPETEATVLAGLETLRFAVELDFEYEDTSDRRYPNDVSWTPVVVQEGILFRPTGVSDFGIRPGDPDARELLFDAASWTFCGSGVCSAPDFAPGAPPIRIGVVLATRLLPNPFAVHSQIRLDDFRVEAAILAPLTVSFLDTAPPASGDGTGLRRVFSVETAEREYLVTRIGLNRPARGEPAQVTVAFPPTRPGGAGGFGDPETLDLSTVTEARVRRERGGFGPGTVYGTVRLTNPSPGMELGTPSAVEAWNVPCTALTGGVPVPCSGNCLFAYWSAINDILFPGLSPRSPAVDAHPTPFVPALGTKRDDAGTLRSFRDQRMAETPVGRYYRDLYEVASPDLLPVLLPRTSLVVSIAEARTPWIDVLDAATLGDGDQAVVTQDMVDDMLGIFDTFEEASDERLQRIFRFERERLRLEDLGGMTIEQAIEHIEERGGPPPCETTKTTLCLTGGRFLAEVDWQDFQDNTGRGRTTPLSDDSGAFWFFDSSNVELVVKVLDATTINDRYWVFFGALTNVAYTLTVTDTVTGAIRAYRNPAGTFASAGDTDAFTRDGNRTDGSAAPLRSPSRLLAAAGEAAGDLVRRGWRRLRNRMLGDPDARLQQSLTAAGPARELTSVGGTCAPSSTALCLEGDRFRVESRWRAFDGTSGVGHAQSLTGNTGTFWFLDPANTELILKVLDATAVNGRYWVFYGALSNLEYEITVTDTTSGATRTYRNPSGTFGSFGDTEAF